MKPSSTGGGGELLESHTVGYRDKAKKWLSEHPYLYAIYAQNKFRGFTSHLRGLPDFVIIGAMKSGTTSLYDFVVRHPAIEPALRKELHYFSLFHHRGELWYRSNFPTNRTKNSFTKKTGQRLLSGEATVDYLFYPEVPARMRKILPDVKLIVILRNPIDRAYSHYHHNISRKNNELLSFEKAIELEEKRWLKERMANQGLEVFTQHYHHNSYLARGIYADQLENWFNHYPREQFLILTTQDFRKNPHRTLNQIFEFLEVSPFHVDNLKDLNVKDYEEMNTDTRYHLIEYFRPHNERLFKLLQRDFDWNK